MTTLLVQAPPPPDGPTLETVFGGRPTAPRGFAWPGCPVCDGAMQFQGQLARAERPGRLLLIFMCQNGPGTCSQWEADDGGNAAIDVATDDVELVPAPTEGEVVRNRRLGARLVDAGSDRYDEVRVPWATAHGVSPRQVLGQVGGEANWLQGEQTPDCSACGQPMEFIAQLEEGPAGADGMNFGGGCAYVFQCRCAGAPAKFLWQC